MKIMWTSYTEAKNSVKLKNCSTEVKNYTSEKQLHGSEKRYNLKTAPQKRKIP